MVSGVIVASRNVYGNEVVRLMHCAGVVADVRLRVMREVAALVGRQGRRRTPDSSVLGDVRARQTARDDEQRTCCEYETTLHWGTPLRGRSGRILTTVQF